MTESGRRFRRAKNEVDWMSLASVRPSVRARSLELVARRIFLDSQGSGSMVEIGEKFESQTG